MPKRSSKPPRDVNQLAAHIVAVSTDGILPPKAEKLLPMLTKEKNPAAVALGRLGGLRGGVARAEKLSLEKRHEIAKKAAEVRWSREKP